MPAAHDTLASADDGRFEEVLAAYLEAADAGWAPSRRAFLERYPAWRDRLQTFFDTGDEVATLTESLRGKKASESTSFPTVAFEGKAGSETLPRMFGEYLLMQMLGRGGMGIVYKARQQHLNRMVALKMILPTLIGAGEETVRFRNEADATARMDHRHIVPIYEVGECDGRQFFSMKLIGSGSLADRAEQFLARLRDAADVVEKIARAVQHAHERGIMHRDLKPGNVLIDEEGEPVVTDFGLARQIEQDTVLTMPGAILGTPSYMAPEQAAGESKDMTTAVDVYALGAILYETITGQPPFKGANALETLLQVREQKPLAPRVRNPNVPRDLEAICLKCLEKDPTKRYASARDLADELGRWRKGELVEARPVSAAVRFWKWTRRRPALATTGILALVVVALSLISLGAMSQLSEIRNARDESATLAEAEKKARQQAQREQAEAENNRQRAEGEKARAESALSITSLMRANLALQDHEFAQAERALDSTPASARNWEWYLINSLVRPPLKSFLAHDTRVPAVACSSGGLMASGDTSGKVVLWDLKSGKPRYTMTDSAAEVTTISFSPDGKTLAYGAGEEVRLMDTESGKVTGKFPGKKNGRWSIGYSPSGEYLATGGEGNAVRIYDKSGKVIHDLAGHQKGVTGLAFSPDSKRLATGDEAGVIRFWNAARGVETRRIDLEGPCRGLAYSPDGRLLAVNEQRFRVGLFDVETGKRTDEIHQPGKLIAAIAFSPVGELAIATSRGVVEVWNLPMRKIVRSVVPPASSPESLTYSPAGWLCIGTEKGSVHLLDTQTGSRRIALHEGDPKVRGAVFSPDGKRAALSVDRLRIWELDNGGESKPVEDYDGDCTCVTFAADGQSIAAGCSDRKVRIWDSESRKSIQSLTCPAPIRGVTFSPAGDLLAASCTDGRIRLWEAKSGKPHHTLQATLLSLDLTFSPDGRLLAAGESNAIQVWDVATGKERFVLRGHTRIVGPIRFSPDGKRLASGSFDGTIRIWNAQTGRLEKELTGHKQSVTALAFDGNNRLASASRDESVRLWNIRLGTEVLTLKDHGGVIDALTFAGDRLLGGVQSRGWVQVWEVRGK